MRAVRSYVAAGFLAIGATFGAVNLLRADAPAGMVSESTDSLDREARAALRTQSTTVDASAEEPMIVIERASGERLAQAIGHYARARSLLIAALREFDKGVKLANPQSLLDVTVYRNTLLDRAEDLERVLDPQPRVTRGGARFEPDSRLLGGGSSK